MLLYARLVGDVPRTDEAADLVRELTEWHDAMVLHQRHVRRVGAREACSTDCPHVAAIGLWKQARRVFGPAADRLEFLRESAESLEPVA